VSKLGDSKSIIQALQSLSISEAQSRDVGEKAQRGKHFRTKFLVIYYSFLSIADSAEVRKKNRSRLGLKRIAIRVPPNLVQCDGLG
jgi:hypothetical protein